MNALHAPLPAAADLAALDERFAPRRVETRSGALVSVRECGQGPVLVCLHGIGSGAASWLALGERLRSRARLIAWDAPGYGASTPLASPRPGAQDYAERLHELLDALDVRRCTLVGHSLGALTAVAAYRQRADRFERVILLSPARGYGAEPARAAAVRAQRLAALEAEGIAGMAAQRAGRLLSPGAGTAARQWVRWNMAQLNDGGYRQAIELLCGEDLLRHLPVPLQVWVGELDEITPPAACESIARAAQTGVRLIAGAGHACYVEQPDAVASLLCAALEDREPESMTDESNDNDDSNAERYNVPALERGLRILGEFSRGTQVVTAPELARRLELPRSTVFRLLATLENMGFLERTDGGNDYRLGLAVLRLGFEYLASLPLNELGQPLLRQLSEEIAYPCNIVVRDGRSIVYVTRVSPQNPTSRFVGAVNVGTRLPAHGTVLGRMVLADLSLAQLKALYPEAVLESFSPSTPKTVAALHELLKQDLQRGHAIGEAFYEPNISTIAAPVRDHSGHIVAALGVTVNAGRFADLQLDQARVDAIVTKVERVAGELSRLLNFSSHAATPE